MSKYKLSKYQNSKQFETSFRPQDVEKCEETFSWVTRYTAMTNAHELGIHKFVEREDVQTDGLYEYTCSRLTLGTFLMDADDSVKGNGKTVSYMECLDLPVSTEQQPQVCLPWFKAQSM